MSVMVCQTKLVSVEFSSKLNACSLPFPCKSVTMYPGPINNFVYSFLSLSSFFVKYFINKGQRGKKQHEYKKVQRNEYSI